MTESSAAYKKHRKYPLNIEAKPHRIVPPAGNVTRKIFKRLRRGAGRLSVPQAFA
jgi:hypothetical protein